jgi:hypothetical protein
VIQGWARGVAILYRPPAWNNDRMTLFHGTDDESARHIRLGIDLSRCRPNRDFGRGFYTTTARRQAEYWAYGRAGSMAPPRSPAIVAFEVELEQLADMETLIFIRGDFDAESFWGLVFHCREGARDHGRQRNGGWYDVVAGPVATDWQQREVFANRDQFSFHTPAGVALLDRSR